MKWKAIPNSDYEVSDTGLVRSLDREVIAYRNGKPHVRRYSGKLLNHQSHPFGYLTVRISIGGSLVTRTVHSLVMEAFVGPCPKGMEVRHLDGNPKNPALYNLQYATPKRNNADKLVHGTDNRGVKHWASRVTDTDVRRIRTLHSLGVSVAHIAETYGLSDTGTRDVITKRNWKHVD